MPLKINYSKINTNKLISNLVLFCNDKFNLKELNKYFSKDDFSYINDLLKSNDLKKNLLTFELSSKKKIVLVSIKDNLKSSDVENLGAEFFKLISSAKKVSIQLFQIVY